MARPLIEVCRIANRFGRQMVHENLCMDLRPGEIHGLVGGSGSGKSVLLRTILGLNRPVEGTVLAQGEDLYAMPARNRMALQRRWGVLFQNGALFSAFDVTGNVCIPLREHTRLRPRDIEEMARAKIRMVGLEREAGAKFPSMLSGGMTLRAALARALALDPAILFLDEPTGALDPMAAAAFDELILKLRGILDLSVLVITHDPNTIATICDRVTMIVDKQAQTGTIEEMRQSPHPEIHDFFNGPRMQAAIRQEAREA